MLRKINLYFGVLMFVVFLYTGYYMVSKIVPHYESNQYLRMANRANHIYMLFIALLNIMIYGYNFRQGPKRLENVIRILLLLAGIFSAIGFFLESLVSLSERMIVPNAVGFAFFSFLLLGIYEFIGYRRNARF